MDDKEYSKKYAETLHQFRRWWTHHTGAPIEEFQPYSDRYALAWAAWQAASESLVVTKWEKFPEGDVVAVEPTRKLPMRHTMTGPDAPECDCLWDMTQPTYPVFRNNPHLPGCRFYREG